MEIDNANNIVKFAEEVLINRQRLSPIIEGKSLKFDIFNLTINQDLSKLNVINEFYDNNSNIFKLVKCFAKAFNYLEGKDKVDTKFEEVSELFF